jgi:hypothetical protein
MCFSSNRLFSPNQPLTNPARFKAQRNNLGRIGERVGPLAKDGEVKLVTEYATALAPSNFLDDAKPLQID